LIFQKIESGSMEIDLKEFNINDQIEVSFFKSKSIYKNWLHSKALVMIKL
jgi:hypothetical protein